MKSVLILALLFAVVYSQPLNNAYLPPQTSYVYPVPPVQPLVFGSGVGIPAPAPEISGFQWQRGCADCNNPSN
ncbi:hypothetical protein D910_03146 [Dendroctonus ponderosae]|uniref:Uncharacterized protein n=1 Tax=Dendroctonus ponderosae TaxID=77166 RepID=U4U555_DENPD|nr:hypothetical protein D910_03146 [Dendroctonus ponderosae]KAH1004951.1 hypothetical protein HUJ05_005712 [Dendroctonus ponderosae]